MTLKETINLIQTKIESAKKRGGFSHPVQLVAVTKTHPFSLIEECYKAGITALGEKPLKNLHHLIQCRIFLGVSLAIFNPIR